MWVYSDIIPGFQMCHMLSSIWENFDLQRPPPPHPGPRSGPQHGVNGSWWNLQWEMLGSGLRVLEACP